MYNKLNQKQTMLATHDAALKKGISLFPVKYAPTGSVISNIHRDQKKPVSTVFIRGNEITQKIDVSVFVFI